MLKPSRGDFLGASPQDDPLSVQQPANPKLNQENYIAGRTMIEAPCRTRLCNQFSESFLPSRHICPEFEKSKDYLLSGINSNSPISYKSRLIQTVVGRVFFITKDGYMGLAPSKITIKLGDYILVGPPNECGEFERAWGRSAGFQLV